MKFLDSSKKEIQFLDFGNVEIGKNKKISCFLVNDSEAELIEIEVSTNNEEVVIENVPEKVKPFSEVELHFIWTPTLKEKKGLKTELSVEAIKIWRS